MNIFYRINFFRYIFLLFNNSISEIKKNIKLFKNIKDIKIYETYLN